jgi:hypothetical protein
VLLENYVLKVKNMSCRMATSAIFSAIDEAPLHAVEKLKAISSHAHGRYKPEHSVAETNAVQDVFLPEMFQNNVEKKSHSVARTHTTKPNTMYGRSTNQKIKTSRIRRPHAQ